MGSVGRSSSSFSSSNYKEFPDTAQDGWSYDTGRRTGQEQVKFFKENSNYDELLSKMGPSERGDFRDWCRGHFMDGQQYDGFSNMTKRDQAMTKTFDKYLDQATLKEPIIVTRRSTFQLVGLSKYSSPDLDQLKGLIGKEFTVKGNMSCGAAKEGLTIGQYGKKAEYRIHIPGGKEGNGAGMWIGDSRINGWGPEQREFMTNRDIYVKMRGVKYDSKRDVYVIDLSYEGRDKKHDYS